MKDINGIELQKGDLVSVDSLFTFPTIRIYLGDGMFLSTDCTIEDIENPPHTVRWCDTFVYHKVVWNGASDCYHVRELFNKSYKYIAYAEYMQWKEGLKMEKYKQMDKRFHPQFGDFVHTKPGTKVHFIGKAPNGKYLVCNPDNWLRFCKMCQPYQYNNDSSSHYKVNEIFETKPLRKLTMKQLEEIVGEPFEIKEGK